MATAGPNKEHQKIQKDLYWDLPDSAIDQMKRTATVLHTFLQAYHAYPRDTSQLEKVTKEANGVIAEYNNYKKTLTADQLDRLKTSQPDLNKVINIHFGSWSSLGIRMSDVGTIEEVINDLHMLEATRKQQHRILKFSEVENALQPVLIDDTIRLIAEYDEILVQQKVKP